MATSMTTGERTELSGLMAAMAAGDIAAAIRFADLFGTRVAAVVRRHLNDLHRNDLAARSDDVEALTSDAVLVIFDKAAGWSPEGGALPWNWADRAIRAAVVGAIGHPTIEFDQQHHDQPARPPTDSLDASDHYRSLVRKDDRVRLLESAIGHVGNERDQSVFRQFNLQQSLGDPSPAQTIAAEFDLTPPNVRQIVHRQRQRLRRLAQSEPRFTDILESSWVAA